MSDLRHWDERAHLSRLRARRRRAGQRRSAGLESLRRRGVVAFLAAMTLSAGAAVAHQPASKPASSKAVVLKKGARGAAVAALQRALGIPADGVFGPQTRRAVRRFQRRHGLLVDGIVGPATRRALGLPAASAPARRRAGGPRGRQARILRAIARCESGGNPRAVSPDGRYRGKYQFSRATWRAMGGKGDPARASEREQDRIAARLLAREGTRPWPACAARIRRG